MHTVFVTRRAPGALATVLAAIAALLSSATPARATQPGDAARFDTWTGYGAGRYVVAAAAGDFDGDGAPDVAWARNDFWNNGVAVQLNHGEGTMQESVTYPAVASSHDVAAGHLDGDADLDLVVVGEGPSMTNQTVDLYLNDGTGTFTHETTPGGKGPHEVAVADLDGDGVDDVALANVAWGDENGSVGVLLANGDGTFGAETRYETGPQPRSVTAGDLDADGDADLVAARYDSDTQKTQVLPLLNDGTGAMTAAPAVELTIAVSGGGSPRVAAGDLDGDGDADLALASGGTNLHYVLINDGTTFAATTYEAGYGSTDVMLFDVDADGDLDLGSATMGDSSTGNVSLLRNAGDGTFAPYETILSGHQPTGLAAADFDGDGHVDVAAANRGSSTGAIHPQRPDGTFAGPTTYGTSWSAFELATADFDLDGDVDVATSVADRFGSDDAIQLQLNDGTGALVQGAAITSGGDGPRSVWAADVGGDAAPDLLWLVDTPDKWDDFFYAINDGDGTFAAPVEHAIESCGAENLTTADADDDGDLDVLVANDDGWCEARGGVSISPNNGDGTFGDDTLLPMTQTLNMAMGADVNADGRTDVVGVAPDMCCDVGQVYVALGTASGFAAPVDYTTGKHHVDMEMDDLEGDGDLDVVTSNWDDTASVLLNDGAGAFASIETYQGEDIAGLLNQVSIDVGDVNGDGNADIVAANLSGNDAGVHYGHGDGTFDAQQVRYGMSTSMRDVALADLDGDGALDVVGATGAASGGGRIARVARAERAAAIAPAAGVSVLINGSVDRDPNACTIDGTAAGETITGTAGRDVICAGRGDDVITGLTGNDVVRAGAGRDVIMPGAGSDRVDGGDGVDTVSYDDSPVGMTIDMAAGSATGGGVDTLVLVERAVGSRFVDDLSGSGARDVLAGLGGADLVRGLGGDDSLAGGGGRDELDGGRGTDRLDGGAGRDTCRRGETLVSC
ncbi:MAG TPA: FG-GAP-like repeat-containing protein [Actinomycetota bacterium]|nr:FG-GAP-like repeat-containing protein [Actinomycetota bacterium]